MDKAQALPMNAVPNAAIGRPSQAPSAPAVTLAMSRRACPPPASPALMASAAASPGGQAASAGNTRLPNMR
jgi:hypothetical protein